jgi:hypothetical protein
MGWEAVAVGTAKVAVAVGAVGVAEVVGDEMVATTVVADAGGVGPAQPTRA